MGPKTEFPPLVPGSPPGAPSPVPPAPPPPTVTVYVVGPGNRKC